MSLWSGQQQLGQDCVTVDWECAFSVRLGARSVRTGLCLLLTGAPWAGTVSTLSLGAPWAGLGWGSTLSLEAH